MVDQGTATYEWDFCDSSKNEKFSSQLDMGRLLLNEAKLGHADEVKQLVAAGAPFTADWLGTSPLHWTAHYNHVDVTELLLRSGISHDARNKVDRTPLHVAAHNGHYEIVKMLLAFGADANAIDMLRMTPLHWACISGNKQVVGILLDHGALPSIASKFGKLPTDVAEDHGFYDIIKFIEEVKSIPIEERTAKINKTKKESAQLGKKLRLNESIGPSSSGDILKMVAKRRKLGFMYNDNYNENSMMDEENTDSFSQTNGTTNGMNTDKTLQLLKDHGIVMLEPDNGTVVSSVVESGHSVKLTEAGKLALNSSKTLTIQVPKPAILQTPKVKAIPAQPTIKLPPNVKKIITIKADELINMAKEKKFIIQPKNGVGPNPRMFEGKFYTDLEQLIEKISTRLSEAEKQGDQLQKMANKKYDEAATLKKNLDEVIKLHNAKK